MHPLMPENGHWVEVREIKIIRLDKPLPKFALLA
jgi:hypothetical protein